LQTSDCRHCLIFYTYTPNLFVISKKRKQFKYVKTQELLQRTQRFYGDIKKTLVQIFAQHKAQFSSFKEQVAVKTNLLLKIHASSLSNQRFGIKNAINTYITNNRKHIQNTSLFIQRECQHFIQAWKKEVEFKRSAIEKHTVYSLNVQIRR